MGKSVRSVKKPDIFTSIIPIYYLSKFTGLAPLSLAYCHDKQGRVQVTLKTSVPAVLYTVLLIAGVTAAQFFVLTYYRFDTFRYGTEGTKQVLVSVFLLRGITCVTSLVTALTRVRKEIKSLLYKLSVIDISLGTQNDILRSNEINTWIQVTSLATILVIAYVNDFFSYNHDFKIVLCGTATYVCTSIKIVTSIQFANIVSLLRQKSKLLNNYLAPDENRTQQRTNTYQREMLLQKPRFINDDIWTNDVLQIWAFYQELNRRHCSSILMQDTTIISIQNSWHHKGKHRFRALRIIWDVLCDISSSVNSMYGLQIRLSIVTSIIEITTNLSYGIIELKLIDFTNVELYHKVVIPIIWALMQFLQLLWIAATCSAACGEANRSVTLLQKLLLQPELHPETVAEIRLFLQQIRDRTPKFTAWDFFTINYSFLGSTVGAIVTFLVILVQMQAN
jgi:hypothetical protein